MASSLGSSSVTIVPEFDEAELKAKLDEISSNKAEITAKILADATKADKTLAEFRAGADKTIKGIPTGDLRLTDSDAVAKLLDLRISVDETIKGLPKGELDLDDTKALAKAAALRVKLDVELKKAGVVDIDVRTDRALAQIAKFDVEAKALNDLAGSGGNNGGWLNTFLTGGEDAGEGSISTLEKIGVGVVALVPALMAASVEITGVVSGFAAAGAGAGAFALLAVPAVTSVFGALGDTKAQLDKLPAGTAQVVEGIQGIEGAWKKASAAFSPQVFDLMNKAIGITAGLLPDVLPFAQQFATSMAPILDKLGSFTESSGFKGFLKDMQGLEGPALTAIANGTGHVLNNFGKLLTVMSSADVVNAINVAFDILSGTITGFSFVVRKSMGDWDAMSSQAVTAVHKISTDVVAPLSDWFSNTLPHAFDDYRSGFQIANSAVEDTAKSAADLVTSYFDTMRKDIAGDTGDITSNVIGAWNDVYQNTDRTWSSISNTISGTIHDVESDVDTFFHSIEGGFSAAVSDISGIWTGLEHDIETPVNFVLGIVSKVDSLLDVIPGVNLPKNLHLAGGGVVPGGIHGIDSVHTVLAPGELVIPSSHAAQFGDAARRAGIPMASGGIVPTPVSGRGGALGAVNPTGGNVNPLTAIASGLADLGDLLAKGAASAVSGLLGSLVNDIPGSGVAKTLAQGMAKEAVSGITGAISGAAMAGLGPATGAASGSEIANAGTIFNYLMSTGRFAPIAAAGAVASIGGESAYNPESVGTGGGGIYGATPLPGGMVTGNASRDLDNQLRDLIQFISANSDWGVIAEMNKATSLYAAAQLWGKGVERYGINDVHPWGLGIAQGLLNSYNTSHKNIPAGSGGMARGGRVKPYSAGGMITEPVAGIGLSSGNQYTFGENGFEQVVPGGLSSAGSPGMPSATQYGQMTTNDLLQQVVNLLKQQPQNTKRAISGSLARGANRGFGGT